MMIIRVLGYGILMILLNSVAYAVGYQTAYMTAMGSLFNNGGGLY